jgi:hypothetical protein
MKILDRYSAAVHSGNLVSNPGTTWSDTDVLGAFGLAAKKRPLSVALARLFMGDNHAAREIVGIMAVMIDARSWQTARENVPRVEAEDIARKVLAWHRDGVCKPCGGHGFALIEGAPSLSGRACIHCRGTRKVAFDVQFAERRRDLALWMRERIEREQSFAGEQAMKMLAPRFDL